MQAPIDIATTRLQSADDPRFAALLAIYAEAIPASEQKRPDELRAMLADPRYRVLVILAEAATAGFAVAFLAPAGDWWLLEYLAIDARFRSRGLGSRLLAEVAAAIADEAAGAVGLLEVERPLDRVEGADQQAARRIAFYARRGARLIDCLDYILPLDHHGTPPPMQLMLLGRPQSVDIARRELAAWLTAVYWEVYGRAAADPRLARMLVPLPERLPLLVPGG